MESGGTSQGDPEISADGLVLVAWNPNGIGEDGDESQESQLMTWRCARGIWALPSYSSISATPCPAMNISLAFDLHALSGNLMSGTTEAICQEFPRHFCAGHWCPDTHSWLSHIVWSQTLWGMLKDKLGLGSLIPWSAILYVFSQVMASAHATIRWQTSDIVQPLVLATQALLMYAQEHYGTWHFRIIEVYVYCNFASGHMSETHLTGWYDL